MIAGFRAIDSEGKEVVNDFDDSFLVHEHLAMLRL